VKILQNLAIRHPKNTVFGIFEKKNHQQKKIASNHPRDISGHLQKKNSFFFINFVM
jgi:hypothetical protein